MNLRLIELPSRISCTTAKPAVNLEPIQVSSDDTIHQPVLLAEVLELLAPSPQDVVVDCTVGFGGHAAAILERITDRGFLLGIDLDASCLPLAEARLKSIGNNFNLWTGNFAHTQQIISLLGDRRADVILADLGVNSRQLNDASRGFSFMHDGPLRMTMNQDASRNAADLVNTLPEKELADLIYRYGQERYSRRIARFICRARQESPIRTTSQLADIVMRAIGPAGRRQKIHPATRTFQALRIAVNGELENLKALLTGAKDILAHGGRIGVISFHSLEDRIVKHSFRRQAKEGFLEVLTPSPIRPSRQERSSNPRSRSAKFRVARYLGETNN